MYSYNMSINPISKTFKALRLEGFITCHYRLWVRTCLSGFERRASVSRKSKKQWGPTCPLLLDSVNKEVNSSTTVLSCFEQWNSSTIGVVVKLLVWDCRLPLAISFSNDILRKDYYFKWFHPDHRITIQKGRVSVWGHKYEILNSSWL